MNNNEVAFIVEGEDCPFRTVPTSLVPEIGHRITLQNIGAPGTQEYHVQHVAWHYGRNGGLALVTVLPLSGASK